MSGSYLDGPAEMRAILSVFRDAVEGGKVSPVRGVDEGSIILGLDAKATFYIELTQSSKSGTLWAHLREVDERDPVASWTEAEVGRAVADLWETCRNRLYDDGVELGIAALTEWLREESR
jgi:hypothetical protein